VSGIQIRDDPVICYPGNFKNQEKGTGTGTCLVFQPHLMQVPILKKKILGSGTKMKNVGIRNENVGILNINGGIRILDRTSLRGNTAFHVILLKGLS
jgi:hypothetical protein